MQPKFIGTFQDCTSLTGPIPPNLFAGISGQPVAHMFKNTFKGCTNLDGEIPPELFSGIKGVPVAHMFKNTFKGCTKLDGEIPSELFSGISGAPAKSMFDFTFYGCTNLRGSSVKIDEKYLYEIWPDATSEHVGLMYSGCENLDDFEQVPAAWK